MPLSKDDNGIRTQYNNYGVRGTDTKFGGETAGESGELRKVEFVFDYDELPALDTSNLAQVIPANAIITATTLDIITAFSAGTIDVGLADDDGGSTITDPNGLVATASGTAVARIAGAGAQINTTIAEKSQVTVVHSGTPTAGRARVVVSYTEIPAAQA